MEPSVCCIAPREQLNNLRASDESTLFPNTQVSEHVRATDGRVYSPASPQVASRNWSLPSTRGHLPFHDQRSRCPDCQPVVVSVVHHRFTCTPDKFIFRVAQGYGDALRLSIIHYRGGDRFNQCLCSSSYPLYLHQYSFILSAKVCSWISPSTTLHPLTLAVLNVLNSVIPVYTDSVILFHLVKEKASQSASRVTLVTTMGAPILLKFARLASAIMYIHASIEFILASFTVANDSIAPDFAMVEIARIQNVYISSSLQLVDNLSAFRHRILHNFVKAITCRYSLRVYWTHILGMRTLSASTCLSALPSSHSYVIVLR